MTDDTDVLERHGGATNVVLSFLTLLWYAKKSGICSQALKDLNSCSPTNCV